MVHVLVPILVLVVFTLVVVGFAIFAWQLFRGSGDLSQRRTERLGAGLGLFVVCLAWQQIDAGGPIFLVFAWGWIAVIPLGLWFFMTGLRWKPTISTWQGSQYFGLALLAAALAWQQGTAPLNFGRTLGVVVAENGEAQFEIKRAGFVGYTLLTTAREFKYPFHLSDRPRQVFWMRNSEAIGIVYPSGACQVFEVELMRQYLTPPFRITREEEEKLRYDFRLTPAEIDEFNAERQQAIEDNRIWTDDRVLKHQEQND